MRNILLVHTSSELYEYLDLEHYATKYDESSAAATKEKVLEKFVKGQFSQVLFISMNIDPLNGVCEITNKEYYKAPLKKKIEINVEAKGLTPKKKSSSEILADMMTSLSLPTEQEVWEVGVISQSPSPTQI